MDKVIDEVVFIFTIRRNVVHYILLGVILDRHNDTLWVLFLHLFLQFSIESFIFIFLHDELCCVEGFTFTLMLFRIIHRHHLKNFHILPLATGIFFQLQFFCLLFYFYSNFARFLCYFHLTSFLHFHFHFIFYRVY